MLDTRRYRSEESLTDDPDKSMLGPQQLEDVLGWLEAETKLKVLVSSVPFTRNWRGPESIDSWAGYMYERRVILESMWKTEGVVVISGVSLLFHSSILSSRPSCCPQVSIVSRN